MTNICLFYLKIICRHLPIENRFTEFYTQIYQIRERQDYYVKKTMKNDT